MIPGSVKVYIARDKADLRKAYDGLGMLVQETLEMDPLSGYVVGPEILYNILN